MALGENSIDEKTGLMKYMYQLSSAIILQTGKYRKSVKYARPVSAFAFIDERLFQTGV